MLLTLARYTELTGDSPSSGAFASAASAAQDLLEDALGRRGKLEEQERTEQCHIYPDGTIYPQAVPLLSVEGGLVFFEDVVYGATPDSQVFTGFFPPIDPPVITLTYTGGFTGDRNEENAMPGYMEQDLAWATYNQLRPTDAAALASIPAGISSASSGDVSISYGDGGSEGAVAESRFAWSCYTLRHRRRSP